MASPQNDQALISGLASGSMKHIVEDFDEHVRSSRLDKEMDELRKQLHKYIEGALKKFGIKVDEIVKKMQESGSLVATLGVQEHARLLRLDKDSTSTHGRYNGGGGRSLDEVCRQARSVCPNLFAEYEELVSLFSLRAVRSERVNTQTVANRMRELVPSTNSHLGGMSHASGSSQRRRNGGGSTSDKGATDDEIVMNAFFHFCDSRASSSSSSSYNAFSNTHFAEDVKGAKENLQVPGNFKAGIFLRRDGRGGPSAVSYAMYYQNDNDSFVEQRVPEGGKNSLYAIYALLQRLNNKKGLSKGMTKGSLPGGLGKLQSAIFGKSSSKES